MKAYSLQKHEEVKNIQMEGNIIKLTKEERLMWWVRTTYLRTAGWAPPTLMYDWGNGDTMVTD